MRSTGTVAVIALTRGVRRVLTWRVARREAVGSTARVQGMPSGEGPSSKASVRGLVRRSYTAGCVSQSFSRRCWRTLENVDNQNVWSTRASAAFAWSSSENSDSLESKPAYPFERAKTSGYSSKRLCCRNRELNCNVQAVIKAHWMAQQYENAHKSPAGGERGTRPILM